MSQAQTTKAARQQTQRTVVDFEVAQGVGPGVKDVKELGNGPHGVDGKEDNHLQISGWWCKAMLDIM
jgi:hypothetical protein